jgi:hypothetical protein
MNKNNSKSKREYLLLKNKHKIPYSKVLYEGLSNKLLYYKQDYNNPIEELITQYLEEVLEEWYVCNIEHDINEDIFIYERYEEFLNEFLTKEILQEHKAQVISFFYKWHGKIAPNLFYLNKGCKKIYLNEGTEKETYKTGVLTYKFYKWTNKKPLCECRTPFSNEIEGKIKKLKE